MSRHDHKDSSPHTLVIEDIRGDLGEIDWHIEHLESCPKDEWTGWDDKHEPMEYYTCLVESVFEGCGLREAIGSTDLDPFSLERGAYLIVGCSTYDDYTHEADTWIEPYPNPGEWTQV